ncbi:hypothetical protein ACA910_020501 [Epithemia clementina (nom. ined.)]
MNERRQSLSLPRRGGNNNLSIVPYRRRSTIVEVRKSTEEEDSNATNSSPLSQGSSLFQKKRMSLFKKSSTISSYGGTTTTVTECDDLTHATSFTTISISTDGNYCASEDFLLQIPEQPPHQLLESRSSEDWDSHSFGSQQSFLLVESLSSHQNDLDGSQNLGRSSDIKSSSSVGRFSFLRSIRSSCRSGSSNSSRRRRSTITTATTTTTTLSSSKKPATRRRSLFKFRARSFKQSRRRCHRYRRLWGPLLMIRRPNNDRVRGFVESYIHCVEQVLHCGLTQNWWNPIFGLILAVDALWWSMLLFVVLCSYWITLYRVFLRSPLQQWWRSTWQPLWHSCQKHWLHLRIGRMRQRLMFCAAMMLMQLQRRQQIERMFVQYHKKHICRRRHRHQHHRESD